MQDKLKIAFERRVLLWQILIAIFFLVYIGLRLINLPTTMIWADDVSTLPSLTFIPWNELPDRVFQHLKNITGPILPTFLDGVLINLFGISILALRLPSVVVSVLGFIGLWYVLKQLFPHDRWAQWIPCLLYCFSIPSIMYAQQIQPTTYYFLASTLQLAVFIPFYRTAYRDPALWQRMVIFVGVSTLAFFFNYISVLFTALLGTVWCFRLYDVVRRKRLKRRDGIRLFVMFAILHLVLLLLVLNKPTEGFPGRSYFLSYYFLNPIEFVQRSYDTITYHFNYVFEPALYKPFGLNLLSLPFVIVVLYGIFGFLRAERLHIVYASFTLLVLFFASWATVYPYGGLRHSFTLAPFLYVFVGYAIVMLQEKRRELILGALLVYMLVCWLIWGVNLYEVRRTRFDVDVIAQAIEEYDVANIVAYTDTHEILKIQDADNGYVVLNTNVSMVRLPYKEDLSSLNLHTPFLLVTYRTALVPTWDNPHGTEPNIIPHNPVAYTIVPLVLDTGFVAPEHIDAQSIYSPMNGFFLYYIEPK